MVRDELDIISETVGHMLEQVDHVIVADNNSRDGTWERLTLMAAGDPGRLHLKPDPEVAYYQAEKMTALAEEARQMGAEWVVPFDADEMWLPARWTIGELLRDLPNEASVAEAQLLDHVATAKDVETDPPVQRMRWRRPAVAPLRKVAVRTWAGLRIAQGNHSAAFPDMPYSLTVTGQLEVRHFPYRSPEQFISKVRNGAEAYAMTDLPASVGAHWRAYGKLSDEQLRDHFYKWFWREWPEDGLEVDGERQPPLVDDPAIRTVRA